MDVPNLWTPKSGRTPMADDFNTVTAAMNFLLDVPQVWAYRSATFTLTSGGYWYDVPFDGTTFDNDGMWDVGNAVYLTVQTPGYYLISYSMRFPSASGRTYSTVVRTARNNTPVTDFMTDYTPSSSSHNGTLRGSTMRYLQKDDQMLFRGMSTASSVSLVTTVTHYCSLRAVWIGK